MLHDFRKSKINAKKKETLTFFVAFFKWAFNSLNYNNLQSIKKYLYKDIDILVNPYEARNKRKFFGVN